MISLPSLLLHALKHVLWAMANANSSDAPIIKLCMCVCAGGGGGGGWTEEGMWECNASEIHCFYLFFMTVYSNCK